MRGNEFIQRVKRIAKMRRVEVRVDNKRGKGSYVTLYFDDRFTIVGNPKKEVKTGTLTAMYQQLRLSREDLER